MPRWAEVARERLSRGRPKEKTASPNCTAFPIGKANGVEGNGPRQAAAGLSPWRTILDIVRRYRSPRQNRYS